MHSARADILEGCGAIIDRYYPSRQKDNMSTPASETPSTTEAPVHPLAALTSREQQVALSLANGLINREIATELNISIKTVDTHRGHILKKLGLRHNVDLVHYMIRNQLVTP